MIDIHFHGLPCVDDGPDSRESAIKLIKEAYQQGTREIVLTPHMNHPMSFGHIPFDKQMQENNPNLFQEFFQEVKSILPDLILHEGAEVYISKKHDGQLHQIPIKTIASTDYILVEFWRDITYRKMDSILYDLYLLGFKPIIAHLEEYRFVCENPEHVRALHRDNYVIQVNAENILENKTRDGKQAKDLIALGVVDIVASDTHNLKHRRPRMGEAKAYIAKTYGGEIASKWFVENPAKILENQSVLKGYKIPKKRRSLLIGACSAAFMIIMVTVAFKKLEVPMFFAQEMPTNNETLLKALASTNSQAKPTSEKEIRLLENPSEPLPIETTLGEGVASDEVLPTKELPAESSWIKADQEDKKLDLKNNGSTHEEQLIESYTSYLTSLQDSYLAAVDGCYAKLKESVKIEDKTKQESAINSILGEIAGLESQVDNKVYKTLYDMQNDLEDYGYNVGVVKTTRQYYIDLKVNTSQKYEAELKNLK